MSEYFEFSCQVHPPQIDQLGHVNNVEYLRWMQNAAMAHSTAQGWSAAAYQTLGSGWVVRSHFIEYLGPAFLGDELIIRTWVSEMKRVTSRRKFEFRRAQEAVLLARAETEWAFVQFATGQPRRIPVEVSGAFQIPSS